MKGAQNDHRRASECIAFARSSHDEQERIRLLIMANILERLAFAEKQELTSAQMNHQYQKPISADGTMSGIEDGQ
jgi:hypothetical protein